MTTEERTAKRIFDKFDNQIALNIVTDLTTMPEEMDGFVRRCATMCIDEIIRAFEKKRWPTLWSDIQYYKKVKKLINKHENNNN